jgi:hypothetical protein
MAKRPSGEQLVGQVDRISRLGCWKSRSSILHREIVE